MIKRVLSFVLLVMATLLGGCNNSGSTVVADNRIYVVSGETGFIVSSSKSGSYTVTLERVDANADWYTDRPERVTGDEQTAHYIQLLWEQMYGANAPNVLLQYRNAAGVQGVFGTITNQRYDGRSGQLSFTLTLIKSSYSMSTDTESFSVPVLTVLNNLTPPAEGSSFALYSDNSNLVSESGGGYSLVLSGVDAEVFWMNHAPARSGNFEQVGSFVNYWDERFGASIPNASLAGDIGGNGYDVLPLTLSAPSYDASLQTLTFTATPLRHAGDPPLYSVFRDAVLFVDAGERSSPSEVFTKTWRGIAYSPIPAKFTNAPTGAFFDSDMTANNFQALWGSKEGCGRNDLEAMAAAGVTVVRLYDYNYQRGSTVQGKGGNGHIAFLDKAQSLGIKVIIPVSAWNFSNDQYAWENIDNTVTQIVESVKKNGAIHPAVHSFSVGNELDLDHYGLTWQELMPRAVYVVKKIHALAPDHYITVPYSTAYLGASAPWTPDWFKSNVPADIYNKRFYNSVQTFKLGDDLRTNILAAYDAGSYGVPLMITELGSNAINAGSSDNKVDQVVSQAQVVRSYLDNNPDSLVKGFCIFQWQNAIWKDGGGGAESTYGIHNYNGAQCSSNTGVYWIDGGDSRAAEDFDVDRLVPITSSAHPEGLLKALSAYFK